MDNMNKTNFQKNINSENNITKSSASLDSEMIEINKLIENLEFDTAKVLLQNKINVDPNNLDVIDTMSEVLMNLDETEYAIELIKRSISLEPNKNAEKYMTLGQLSDCKTALKYYEKGVSIFQSDIHHEKDAEKIKSIKNSLASAYATIAELFMNTDLW